MQVGKEELTEYRGGHGCNTQVEISKKIKEYTKGDKKRRSDKTTTETSQLPTPLCYAASVGNITVGGLLWLLHLQAARQKLDRFQIIILVKDFSCCN